MEAGSSFGLQGRMQADTRESFRLLAEMSPDAIILIDPRGIIQALNQSALTLYGLARIEDVVGLHILDLTAREDHERLMKDFAVCMEIGCVRHRLY